MVSINIELSPFFYNEALSFNAQRMLAMQLQGSSNDDIADHLGYSRQNIKRLVSEFRRRIGVKGQTNILLSAALSEGISISLPKEQAHWCETLPEPHKRVLRMIARGMNYAEIAESECLAEITIKKRRMHGLPQRVGTQNGLSASLAFSALEIFKGRSEFINSKVVIVDSKSCLVAGLA